MKYNTLKASDAERLQNDIDFRSLVDGIRQEQINIFVQSQKDDVESREEAHSILRALDKIERVLQSVITDEAIKRKREK
jgi:hypothetical protein